MARASDYIGKKFGFLTIVKFAGWQNFQRLWKCQCECGKEIIIHGENMERKKIVSCGCAKKRGSVVYNKEAEARILSHIEIYEDHWIWKGGVRKGGKTFYTTYMCKQLNPVKYFYEKEHGQTPVNWYFKRTCQERKCVNPDHHVLISISAQRYRKEKKNEGKH